MTRTRARTHTHKHIHPPGAEVGNPKPSSGGGATVFFISYTGSLDGWGLSVTVASEPAAAGSDLVILDCNGLLEHLDDAPSQHDVYQALTGVLPQRLEAVSRQTFPLVDA